MKAVLLGNIKKIRYENDLGIMYELELAVIVLM